MAFGLPSAEEIRDYLISQGKDPVEAAKLANVAARQNAAQAARTSALSVLAGAAPTRAAGAAAIEAAPAAGRAAMSVAERVAAAPRNIWEYLTVPQGVIRNPTTGARIPGQHPAGTLSATGEKIGGQRFRQPDYFLPGQNLAQGAAGAGALGAGAAGASALMDRPTSASIPANYNTDSGAFNLVMDAGAGRGHLTEGAGDRYASMVGAGRGIVEEQPGERAKYQAAQDAMQVARERVAPPMPQRRPEGLGEQPGGLASLFNRPVSTKDLYQQSQDNPDDAGAYMRAERQFAKMHPDERSFDLTKLNDQGMASGGAAKGKPEKDAALHKALDIISHMLGRH